MTFVYGPLALRMIRSIKRSFISGLLLTLSISTTLSAQTPNWVVLEGKEVHPTRILAGQRADSLTPAGESTVRSLAQSNGLRQTHPFKTAPRIVIFDSPPPSPTSPNSSKAQAAAAAPEKIADRLKERIAALQATGEYEFVEPDYRITLNALPYDSALSDGQLWGLQNLGQNSGVAGVDIDAEEAWEISTGSSEVIVAVIDTGIRYTHQDLNSQMWRNPGESGGGRETNGIDDDQDGYIDNVFGINAVDSSGDPWDDNDHGTHCAGTIGAAANNAGPIVGVAWQVRIMAVKFLDFAGSGSSSDAIECIDFAVTNGAHILSNSWGGGGSSQAMRAAIQAAHDRGVLFVAAAGNDGSDNDTYPQYPANYSIENVISVAAIDRRGELASFSNYGYESVDIAAPGVDIYSSTSGSDRSYEEFSGTSMAAPHVAGVAALIVAENPNISITELRARLLQGSVPLASLNGIVASGSRVSAHRALIAAEDGELEIAIGTLESSPLRGGSSVTFTARVTDLTTVPDAQVTGSWTSGPLLVFQDDGSGPDATAHDGTYSVTTTLPQNVSTLRLTVTANALGKLSQTVSQTFALSIPPPNDDFAQRSSLVGNFANVTAATGAASKEPSEPNHANDWGGKSVWWQWTAPANGTVLLSTSGSNFDTTLAVYLGFDVRFLIELKSDDDSGQNYTSALSFDAVAGITYAIAVDGFDGNSGTVELELQFNDRAPVSNDHFSTSNLLADPVVSLAADNRNASREAREPVHAGAPGGSSLWWRWIAPRSGITIIDTEGSSIDTILGVYRGSSLDSLVVVASDDDSGVGQSSRVEFSTLPDTVYHIAIDGYQGATGNFRLNLTHQAKDDDEDLPFNDDLASSRPLDFQNSPLTVVGHNRGATSEPGEPIHAGKSGGSSVWWHWTPVIDTPITVDTSGSDFDTMLGIYTSVGDGIDALLLVGENDDAQGLTSAVKFLAQAHTTYRIAVDGYDGATGQIELTLTRDDTVYPANDSFSNPIQLSGESAHETGSNHQASREPGEPQPAGDSSHSSVWWSWTAPAHGRVTINTLNSSFDTVLAIYTGDNLPTLQEIAKNDDSPNSSGGNSSEVNIFVEPNTTYHIAVDGYNGATGDIALALAFTSQPRRSRLTNFSVRASSDTNQSLVLGFSSRGTAQRPLLLRAIGPSLTEFGISDALPDPKLSLYENISGISLLRAENDNWGGDPLLAANFARLGAFTLPSNSLDAALLMNTSTGTHTAVISGQGNSGVILIEAYEIDPFSADSELSNISVRNFVGSGDDVLVLGFVLQGDSPREILVRGIGPTLASFGVSSILADPQLQIFRSDGSTVATNDDWNEYPELTQQFRATGAFALPSTSSDSALTVTLEPGVYSVVVKGANDTSGVALVEVYLLP